MKRLLWLGALAFAGCANLGVPTSMGDLNDSLQNAATSAATGAATGAVDAAAHHDSNACSGDALKKYDMNPESEYWFGRSVADRLLAPYVPERVYPADSAAAIYLNEVGQVAADAAEQARSATDRPKPAHGYRFILVKDPNPGAWSTPGGFVIVTDGLVARAASEDQLAGILSHEIAHVQRGHGVIAFEKAMCDGQNGLKSAMFKGAVAGAVQGAQSGFGSSLVDRLPTDKLVAILQSYAPEFAQWLSTKGYGTKDELEADAFGTRYLAHSGYSVLGMADYLTRVANDPAFKGDDSHPSPQTRIAAIQKVVQDDSLAPAHSPNEAARVPRFVKAMIASRIRPDWSRKTDPAQAPLLPPSKTASAN